MASESKKATEAKTLPNVLITGTPGVGKTEMAIQLVQQLNAAGMEFKRCDIGALVKEKELHEGYDEEFDTYTLDEDKVCDELEDTMTAGGVIADFHSCGFFPERWFQLVIVLQCENTVLYPRLEARGYQQNKITENIEAEIMNIVLDEARESYAAERVVVLQSESVEQMEENIGRAVAWAKADIARRQSGGADPAAGKTAATSSSAAIEAKKKAEEKKATPGSDDEGAEMDGNGDED